MERPNDFPVEYAFYGKCYCFCGEARPIAIVHVELGNQPPNIPTIAVNGEARAFVRCVMACKCYRTVFEMPSIMVQ